MESTLNGLLANDLLTAENSMIALSIEWGPKLLAAILIVTGGWAIGNWISRRIQSIHRLDKTLSGFLGGLIKYIIFAVSVVTVIGLFGIPMASMLAILGAAGLAIGLALQGTLSNVASGVMLLILRPFNVGDYIEFGGFSGTVESLGLFGTELAAADNVYIFAPNSKIWGTEIKNFSRNPLRQQDITVKIDAGADIDHAFSVLRALIESEDRILKTEGKQPKLLTSAISESGNTIILRMWSRTADYWSLKWDMTKALKETLEREGIALPISTQRFEMIGGSMAPESKNKAA